MKCQLCNKDIPENERHGGRPKYCLECLEELKDEYPFKIYYERRSLGLARIRFSEEGSTGDRGGDISGLHNKEK